MKIVLFDVKSYDREFFERANSSFGFEILYIDAHLTKETAMLAQGCFAACVFVNDVVSKEVIECLYKQGVKVIALRCAGYNNVDLGAANKKLKVVRVPSYSPYAVAEHAVGMMLCLNRNLHRAYLRTKENNFSIAGFLGFDMFGKTAGIIGCGEIGQTIARILKGFGIKVLGYDVKQEQVSRAGCIFADLPTLYKESHIISLHCPLTPENFHMINKEAISQMKEGVMIINTGRGSLINTGDLIEGLKSKKIGSAGLDVYEEESSYFYEDLSLSFIPDDILARLLTFPNVLITSHQAFFTTEALKNIAQTTLENIKDIFDKKTCPNEIEKLSF